MSEQEFNKVFAQNLNYYLEKNEKTQADLAKYVGVSTAAVNTWCKGLKNPRMDKVDKICTFLNVKRSDLISDNTTPQETHEQYYLNEDARDMAQFMFDNPEYKVLFDASRKVKKEDIEFVKEMIDRLSNKE